MEHNIPTKMLRQHFLCITSPPLAGSTALPLRREWMLSDRGRHRPLWQPAACSAKVVTKTGVANASPPKS